LRKLLVVLSLFAALGLWFCSPTMAATYDLAADFTAVQNPNGVWSYGWTANRGSTFHLVTTPGQASSYGTLIGWIPYADIISPAYAVTDWSAPTEFVPLGTVNLHPGPLGQNSVVRWTAPSAGTYTIQGWFKGNNFGGPTSTDVAILHGTAEIFTGAINSFNVRLNFALTKQLNAGDTIDFTVGYGSNGNYADDATGISATIITEDLDGDGIADKQDECPNSDLSATVVIDGCNSGVPNTLFASGCTISDLIIECAEGASDHGQFVSCIAHLTNALKKAGTITGQQKGAIQSCAAQADIP
jgi:hypothetical protein